ncbi:MAG TPA: hypothetical protein VKH63_10575 [Candidatus Acidoferrum sp.]|nr:hypothetical protein [Candidatus Acidoferrum sp.]
MFDSLTHDNKRCRRRFNVDAYFQLRHGLAHDLATIASKNEYPKLSGHRTIALLGRRDAPTEAVEEYCQYLGAALSAHDFELKLVRVAWLEDGWPAPTASGVRSVQDNGHLPAPSRASSTQPELTF